jgi:hypothetical protein
VETYHNRKREVPVVPIVTIEYIKPIARTKTQPIKLKKIPIRYPCIISYNIKHR